MSLPKGWSWPLRCSNCGRKFPRQGLPYRCPTCGGHFDLEGPMQFDPGEEPGLARYRASFPLPAAAEFITLGEGGTPLVAERYDGRRIYLKCEHLNPTGSFKDRGSAVLVSGLKAAGVERAVEDSSGNAGASFAAYAARAGISARIFIPDYASGPKRAQIAAYGAEVVRILGPRSETAAAVRREAESGIVYASHAYLPQGLPGMATLAFELVEALGRAPGTLILPTGHGTLLLGAYLGFRALLEAGRIDALPKLIGVQAQSCAPLWTVHTSGTAGLEMVREGETIAEGIRILRPLRGDAVIRAVEASAGTFVAVTEDEISAGLTSLAARGYLVEPTSAVVWPAFEAALEIVEDPIVLVLTGSGFKANPSVWRARPVGEEAGVIPA